jgi:hypothetical protein
LYSCKSYQPKGKRYLLMFLTISLSKKLLHFDVL